MFDVNNSTISDDQAIFFIDNLIKQSNPGNLKNFWQINLPRFNECEEICYVKCLTDYIERTKPLRKHSRLFISVRPPHKGVGRQTISRWIKNVLKESGIDTNVFTAHSNRAASTSAAARSSTVIDTISTTAGWSNVKTFAKFYHKPLCGIESYGRNILSSCSS